jgi:hypothetical protein
LPPLREPDLLGVALLGAVVVVEGVEDVPVDCDPVVPLGAAAAPAMPAAAPPVARAPSTRPTRIIWDLLIGEPPLVACVTACGHAGDLP